MTREALETFIARQVQQIAPTADAKARDFAVIVIMAQVEAYALARAQARGDG